MIPTPARISLLLIDDDDQHFSIVGDLTGGPGSYRFTGNRGQCLAFRDAWHERARLVTPDLVDIFGPDVTHFVPLTIGNIPDGFDPAEFLFTGFRLPDA